MTVTCTVFLSAVNTIFIETHKLYLTKKTVSSNMAYQRLFFVVLRMLQPLKCHSVGVVIHWTVYRKQEQSANISLCLAILITA